MGAAPWTKLGSMSATPDPPVARRPWLPYLAAAGAATVWAVHFVVARASRESLPPVSLAFWRWTIALAALLPFVAAPLRLHAAELWAARGLLLWLGATGVVAFQVFTYQALARTEVVNAALVAATGPAVIALLAWAIDGVRIARRQAVGIGVSLLGVLVILSRGDPATLWGLRLAAGDLWMVAAVPMWGVYSVLLRRLPRSVPPLASLAAVMLTGWLMLVPLVLVATALGERVIVTPASVAAAVYTGLFAGLLGFVWWNRGVAGLGAARAGVFLHLMPIVATALGVLLLGERLAAFHLVGAALVLLGIRLAGRSAVRRG
jgi:drug/metabolite transporter (DMT)-like permease